MLPSLLPFVNMRVGCFNLLGQARIALSFTLLLSPLPHPLSMDKSWAVRVCTSAALGVTLFAILGGGSSACVDRYLVWNGRGTCAFEK